MQVSLSVFPFQVILTITNSIASHVSQDWLNGMECTLIPQEHGHTDVAVNAYHLTLSLRQESAHLYYLKKA